MKKYLLILLSVCTFLFNEKNLFAQAVKDDMRYPIVDFTTGVGFMWLFQFNLTLSPREHFFVQPRVSIIPLLAYDLGGNIGYQIQYQGNMILRFGVGYSQGEVIPFYVTGDINAKSEEWRSVYIRAGMLKKLGKHAILNPNINITRIEFRPIFSFNITLGYAIFR